MTIYRLVQYFGIFGGGMKNQWEGLNYIEIGGGPGRFIVRETCMEFARNTLGDRRRRIRSAFPADAH